MDGVDHGSQDPIGQACSSVQDDYLQVGNDAGWNGGKAIPVSKYGVEAMPGFVARLRAQKERAKEHRIYGCPSDFGQPAKTDEVAALEVDAPKEDGDQARQRKLFALLVKHLRVCV